MKRTPTVKASNVKYSSSSTKKEMTSARAIRHSWTWVRLREKFLRQNPICADPLNIHRIEEFAVEVHHIERLENNLDKAFDINNLAPLCHECHRIITSLENNGNNTTQYFVVDKK